MKETNNRKHLLIGLIAILGVVILALVSSFLFKEEKEEVSLDDFKIENTCWSYKNDKSILCFGKNKVYNVDKINKEYRKTNYKEDTYSIDKKSETDGTLSSNKWDHLLIGYVVKEEDNKLILWTTSYDTILEKNIEEEYELMDIKNDDIKITEEYITYKIFDNEFKRELSNTYYNVNFKLPLYSILKDYEKDIKADNKKNYASGYRLKYTGEKGGYFYYILESDYNYVIKNDAYSAITKDRLCYSTEYVKNESDFTKKLDKRTRQVVVHYCSYLKDNEIEITTTTTRSSKISTVKKDDKTISTKTTSSKTTSKTTSSKTSIPTTIVKEVEERNSINKMKVTLSNYDDESFKVSITNPDNIDVSLYIDNKYYDINDDLIFKYEKSGENCISVKLKGKSATLTADKCITFTPKKIDYALTKTNNASGCVLHIANRDDKSPSYNDLKNTTCDLKHRTMSCHKLEKELLSPGTYTITAKNKFGGQQVINVICD